ncbi:hypothetical protein HDF24_13910 [Mucilaginibacter sp. X4EP1]|uniref:hypothetical protein n=1 Tax=Mucilaginibacter sp. X4EP1 TaxID=2723092 RepID=UPI0021697C8E|nr:hypothetical protein [Mucilaginibacter sp. X4EP1]MCS3814659.1 hypothetical protein [Mucilaginibacter sp. X4EP1]
MKKIILIATILLFAIDVNAQSAGPNELHCTEEAFTFRTDIKGWHFSAPTMGPAGLPKNTSTYNQELNVNSVDVLPGSSQLMNIQGPVDADSFNLLINLHNQNTIFYSGLYHVKLTDQLKYLLPGNFQFPYQTGWYSGGFIIQNQAPALR